jgi:hypothetical protein
MCSKKNRTFILFNLVSNADITAIIRVYCVGWDESPFEMPATVGQMRIEVSRMRANRKPAIVPLCPPQIPDGLTLDQTQATVVGCWQLTS